MTEGRKKKGGLSVREMVLFAFLGTMMFVGKLAFEFIPNVHPLALLTVVYTIVYRRKALIPIYVFVLLTGIYAGFNIWWIPYFYLWTVLWGVTMLLPVNMPVKAAVPVYMAVCALHGLFYGTLYSPFQALAFGYSRKQWIAWIIAGLPWDGIHALGNLAAGTLVVPLSRLLKKLDRQ